MCRLDKAKPDETGAQGGIMAKYLIGVDNGLTMSKAAVFDLEGKELAVASRKSGWVSPNPGWYERDMAAAWQAAAESIKEAVKKA